MDCLPVLVTTTDHPDFVRVAYTREDGSIAEWETRLTEIVNPLGGEGAYVRVLERSEKHACVKQRSATQPFLSVLLSRDPSSAEWLPIKVCGKPGWEYAEYTNAAGKRQTWALHLSYVTMIGEVPHVQILGRSGYKVYVRQNIQDETGMWVEE